MSKRRLSTVRMREYLDEGSERTHIKLCGMFREQDIDAVNEALPDLCGFIVDYPSSHRHVGRDKLLQLVGRLDPQVPAVGVFVDEPLGLVSELADTVLDMVQLHGNEENPYIARLRELVDIPICQAIRVRTPDDVRRANESKADIVLLDSGAGSGRAFDWSLIQGVERPFILAGGLDPQNVGEAIDRFHPWGVDMSSGIETDRLKDPRKIRAAVAAVRGKR
ncbi:MAG: phosphoribosylanthranilate isomerase [Olsenella sp.]|jgi:phosphoribosylanthranilate isomerase|nr:phosphoribosylanthranilate isomerase [Olsenella sp.]MCH3957447.1 phosphoribosylanthranilate isomerase [Olsenella sp.]MCI1646037.1 phosphoribosylanthranilate isomerase [Olsenella sp.]MCI1794283.1 phosphoribosylanthranilate isomerase [Olsenella sp.]MCI1811751.1 phosphoribosylanthranilate isomerase [Olsenella sp.]